MKATYFAGVVAGAACAAGLLVGVYSRISTFDAGAAGQPSSSAVAPAIGAMALRAGSAVLAADARVQFGEWQYAGPANVGADAVAIVAGPGNVVHSLSLDGTVFRSDDVAATWSAQATVWPREPESSMQQLTVLPASASWPETYFVVAGEPMGRALYLTSHDAPAQRVALTGVRRMTVAGTTVYAAAAEGLWRSEDAGQTWQKVIAAVNTYDGCSDVVAQGNVTYALCDDIFYRSSNGGAFAGLWQSSFVSLGQLAVSRSNPQVVYTARNSGEGAWLHRSTDGGATWTQVLSSSTATNPMNRELLGRYCDSTGINPPEHFAFAVDPLNPDVVWMGYYEL